MSRSHSPLLGGVLCAIAVALVGGCGSSSIGALSLARLALMPAAALVVHQSRYWPAFGGRAELELARQGHSYLYSPRRRLPTR